jgi:hypothetical protein
VPRVALLLSVVLGACRPAPAVIVAPPPAPAAAVELEAAAPYGPAVVSLRVKKSVTVRERPDERSAPLGVLAQDMRVGFRGAALGPGCPRWIEIEPQGFVCEQVLEPTRLGPLSAELPKLSPGALLPGVYGVPIGRAAKDEQLLSMIGRYRAFASLQVLLKFRDQVKVGRRTYLRTRLGQLVDARQVRVREGSEFGGIEVGPEAVLPLAWAQSRIAPKAAVAVWSAPEDGELVGLLEPRAAVPILGQTDDGLWAHVGKDAYISLDDLHVARLVEPPAEVGKSERWVDVDLKEQVLVAYEGRRPVFTTLVSTGAGNPTPQGSWRIWVKFAEADMQGAAQDHRYAVSSVPWTMYFHKDFALHGAYWHDGFGQRRSNGCVNLAPRDARRIYQWTWPAVPEGWSMSYSTGEIPGSLVQIRKSESSFNDVPPVRAKPVKRLAVATRN